MKDLVKAIVKYTTGWDLNGIRTRIRFRFDLLHNRIVFNQKKVFEFHRQTPLLSEQIAKRSKEVYRDPSTDNRFGDFFLNTTSYGGRYRYLPFENPFFLYPPNVGILDYLLRENDPKGVFLDIGCGLGYSIIYLSQLGLSVHGFDEFQQVSKASVIDFLEGFSLRESLLDNLNGIEPNFISIVGVPLDDLETDNDDVKQLINKPCVRLLFLDAYFCRGFSHPHYKIKRTYKELLNVYERVAIR